MPELAVDNGASLGVAITAAHKDIVALQGGIGGLTDIAKTTSDSCVRIDTTLASILGIEQEKLAHKKRMQEKQWAFLIDNWKIIAFIVAVLWMPEAVPSIVGREEGRGEAPAPAASCPGSSSNRGGGPTGLERSSSPSSTRETICRCGETYCLI